MIMCVDTWSIGATYRQRVDIIIDKKDDVIALQERDVIYDGDTVTTLFVV